jgi:hypothetical protein
MNMTTENTETLSVKISADAQQAVIRTAPTAQLLRTAYSLTHRMHAEQDAARRSRAVGQNVMAADADAAHADLRAMRDLIDAEIERRCAR